MMRQSLSDPFVTLGDDRSPRSATCGKNREVRRPDDGPRATGHGRPGFTLVELLVAITIIVILAGLTLAIFNAGTGRDSLRAAAREAQSQLEGARSRSVFSTSRSESGPVNVGVRFLQDETNPTIATSMMYVEATTPETGLLRFANYNEFYPMGHAREGDPRPHQRTLVEFAASGPGNPWNDLYLRGLLVHGVRIRIGGLWYAIDSRSFPLGPSNADPELQPGNRLLLSRNYTGDPMSSGTEHGYTLELAPSVMANQEPVALPQGTAIQLAASKVPELWQVRFWREDADYGLGALVVPPERFTGLVYEAIKAGHSANTEPAWPTTAGNVVNDGNVADDEHVIWLARESVQMDVMFTPRGMVTGSAATTGVIHLVLRDTTDILSGVGFITSDLDGDGTLEPVADKIPDLNGDGQITEDETVQGESLILSIFTRTGHITVSPLDVTDVIDRNGTPDDSNDDVPGTDNIPDDPYRYAETGEVAQ